MTANPLFKWFVLTLRYAVTTILVIVASCAALVATFGAIFWTMQIILGSVLNDEGLLFSTFMILLILVVSGFTAEDVLSGRGPDDLIDR